MKDNAACIRVKTDKTELDKAIEKAKKLEDMLKEASSILHELASEDIVINVTFDHPSAQS